MKLLKAEKYVIGVDGGATKTKAVLADLEGNIIKTAFSGSSSLRNRGIEKSIDSLADSIKKIGTKNVSLMLIGLPDVAEEFGRKVKEIEGKIAKKIKFKNVKVVSDQIVAFRSGTDERDGVILIAGTGSIARGWNNGRDEKASGWGWLAEEGCSFWAGREALQIAFRNLDDGDENILTKTILEKLNAKNANDLAGKIYSGNILEKVCSLAEVLDDAAKKGDLDAKSVLSLAGEKASLAAGIVARKLDFSKPFPLVISGSMFNSKDFRSRAEDRLREFIPNAQIIFSENPAMGAVKLAIEKIKDNI